ncbi:MAG: peptidylprolyl isomerase [Planctomycetota bacterium]
MNRLPCAVVCAVLAGCAATSPAPAPVPRAPARDDFTPRVAARPLLVEPQATAGEDPLALPRAEDLELARVGDDVIRKSQVFDRLAELDPGLAQTLVDSCVLDRVIAAAVVRFAIVVTTDEVESRAKLEETTLRVQEGKGTALDDASFATFVTGRFGTTVEGYRDSLRREVLRVLLRSYAIRYLALREDRAEVRVIVHRDAGLLADLAGRVREGADFATLARRYSEDASASDGGSIPPLPRSDTHPIARAAFALTPGTCSQPIALDGSGRHALVFCVSHQSGRDLAFGAVHDEIARALDTRPITPSEQNAFVMRYCRGVSNASTDSLDSVQPAR